MSIIPNFYLNAVVALGIDGVDGEKHWIGTGFIVGRKETSDPNLSTFYIIRAEKSALSSKRLFVVLISAFMPSE